MLSDGSCSNGRDKQAAHEETDRNAVGLNGCQGADIGSSLFQLFLFPFLNVVISVLPGLNKMVKASILFYMQPKDNT